MLALAFLGMAASILVGLLASRVGAGVGRRLRENVFRKWLVSPMRNLINSLRHH